MSPLVSLTENNLDLTVGCYFNVLCIFCPRYTHLVVFFALVIISTFSNFLICWPNLPQGSGKSARGHPSGLLLDGGGLQLGKVVHSLGGWGGALSNNFTSQRVNGRPAGLFPWRVDGGCGRLFVSQLKVGLHVVLLGWCLG